MFGMRKQQKSPDTLGAPLSITSAAGDELYVFTPEIVANVRHLVTSLACDGGVPTRLSVVSALREEGVTHTALALATVLASDTAARVCAVELNWWSPGMLTMLSKGDLRRKGAPAERSLPAAVANRPRLSEVIAGKATLDSALIPTALPNLSLLPAGEMPLEQRPTAARGQALRSTIDELASRFDHLILDIPAVLATSDAIALASLGDATALVVRHGLTPTQSVQLALDDIKHLKMLGVILTKAKFHTPRFILDLVPQE